MPRGGAADSSTLTLPALPALASSLRAVAQSTIVVMKICPAKYPLTVLPSRDGLIRSPDHGCGLRDFLMATSMRWEWQIQLPRLGASALFSLRLLGLGKLAAMSWGHSSSPTEASSWQPVMLEADLSALIKASDDQSSRQCPDCNLVECWTVSTPPLKFLSWSPNCSTSQWACIWR